MTGDAREEVARLLAENRRLRELLSERGIAWKPRDITPTTDRSPGLGTDEKVKLFASLFRDREAVAATLSPFEQGSCGFADCLVVAKRARKGCEFTATSDRGMHQVPGLKVL